MSDVASSDEMLMGWVTRGDVSSFELLYDRHAGWVRAWAAHALGRHRADDTLQEVFMRAWRGAAQFDPSRGQFVTWLAAITRHHVARQLTRGGPRQQALAAETIEAGPSLRAVPVTAEPDGATSPASPPVLLWMGTSAGGSEGPPRDYCNTRRPSHGSFPPLLCPGRARNAGLGLRAGQREGRGHRDLAARHAALGGRPPRAGRPVRRQPYVGGQVAPRVSKWITPDAYMFLQFDDFPPEKATKVTYAGIAVKGVFCAEAQPDAERKSFTHFHRPNAEQYQQGHGGPPGERGYWLSWLAVDDFKARDGRDVVPGVDYAFAPTPAPPCGSAVPSEAFQAPGERTMSKQEVLEFGAFFDDQLLQGGQQAPRLSKWLNEDVALFLQLDNPDLAEATSIRYIGIYTRGVFCKSMQPSSDFTHYHRLRAPEYQRSHAGEPGESAGFWLAWMSTQSFQSRDGRTVSPGIDRQFSPTPPPDC